MHSNIWKIVMSKIFVVKDQNETSLLKCFNNKNFNGS